MLKNLSFRQKIFVSLFFIAFLFLSFLLPFSKGIVNQIVRNSLEKTTQELILELKKQGSEEGMVEYLKTRELFVFFRVSLIDGKYQLVYDTRLTGQLGEIYQEFYPSAHPEVVEAFEKGVGYYTGWSKLFHRDLSYVAVRFYFEEKPYILRTSFPFAQLEILVKNFQIGLFFIDLILLLVFSLVTWVIFARLSRPIQEIIERIKPYQEGKEPFIPKITLQSHFDVDFNRLAETLNSLSSRVKNQIQSILQERNEKEAILESLVEGVVAVDAAQTVQYINFTGSKMLGISKRQLLGNPFPVAPLAAKEEFFKRCKELLFQAQQQESVVTDSLCIENGVKVYLDLIAVPKIPSAGAILVLQDKSNHHRVLEMGKDFIANASHELRTPITIIRGFAETLQDLPAISTEMLKDITEKIVRNCQRMDTLVKNLLTLADIENLPETHFQACDMGALVEDCRHVVISVHPEAHITLHRIQEKILVSANPDLLELAIMNLLENAVKYSTPPAHITVYLQEKEEGIEIKISDQGIGIPEQDQAHIFERFYTVDKARSRRLGGAGLGLSIVKTIVEKHEGKISVASQIGKGTTFTLLFPPYGAKNT